MSERFAFEKENILSQFILHHEVADQDVPELARRLDETLDIAARFHAGQKRKTGEDYIHHPLRTAMEVSRFGRIVDWPSIEASLLHDLLEDTEYPQHELERLFPAASGLVQALTKIKDSRELSYQKLFRFALQDIRVLLVKLADRLDNLESLHIFKPDKQVRIARESAMMYANICHRLCMTDLAERLTEKAAQFLTPERLDQFRQAQEEAKNSMSRSLGHLRSKLAEIFPGDMGARVELRWNRFNPELPLTTENLFTVRLVTDTVEDAYRALGRVHTAFRAIPGSFTDTLSTPRKNGFHALETSVSHRNNIVRFYIAHRAADRYNRIGLLSMDIESPQFNMEYLDDLREFLQREDGDIQDFLHFQAPDAIQVTSPKGEVFSLEEGATALDFAFSVHLELGLRATGATVNDEPAPLDTPLNSGDRVQIEAADGPVCDERYLGWAKMRRSQTALRRHLRKIEGRRAASTGKQWLTEAGTGAGLTVEITEALARRTAEDEGLDVDDLYQQICLGQREIEEVLGPELEKGAAKSLVQRLRPKRPGPTRKVRRYDFKDPHIRFCPVCTPLRGDEIEGTPEDGRLVVHRPGCPEASEGARVGLDWERSRANELRDPGRLELELGVEPVAGMLFAVVAPFRDQAVEVETVSMPGTDKTLRLISQPGTARTLNRLIRALRKLDFVRTVRVHRAIAHPELSSLDGASGVPED